MEVLFTCRYVVEPVAGSSHARSRAYDESIGDICVYVDDVVLVSSSWLVGLIDVFNSSDADFVGGPVKLWWREVDRPEWFTEDCDALLAQKILVIALL